MYGKDRTRLLLNLRTANLLITQTDDTAGYFAHLGFVEDKAEVSDLVEEFEFGSGKNPNR